MRTLLHICLERVCRLLKSGIWNRCAQNPFSLLPVQTMDILMEFLLSVPTFIRTSDLRLILQSAQLSQFDLSTLLIDEEKRLLLLWMSVDACENLRKLSVLHPLCDESGISVVMEILQRCHNLEDFHSKIVTDMYALRNCNQLKFLRLHLRDTFNEVSEDFYLKIVDFCQSKQNLEVFSFCDLKDGFSSHKVIATILESCPKLVSVGLTDSLEALYHIRETRETMVKLKLRRCVWGRKEGDIPSDGRLPKKSFYNLKFPDLIRNAIHMCPAVDTLVLNVFHDEVLEHLINLRQLRSLSLKFNYKSAENVSTLVFLLRRIGPLLEHLSLDIDDTVPAEVIRDHCFNLKSLQVYGSLVLNDDMVVCINPLSLERLHVWEADCKSLHLLLRNSPNLTELYVGEASCLDDELMGKILENNFIYNSLKVVGIRECPLLSENGMHMLVTSACNLKEIFFGSLGAYKLAHLLIERNSFKILHYYDTFKLTRREFFVYRPSRCFF